MNKTLLATAVLMALTGVSQATTTDYSNKTLTSAVYVNGTGNSATGNNVTVTSPTLFTTEANVNFKAGYYNGIFVYNGARERQKFCVHGIIGARQTGASNEHEHQTQFS